MNRQECERPGRLGTRAPKFNLAVEEAVERMFACGLPRKEAKGTSSTPDESVRFGDPDNAGTAGTGRQEPRWMRT